MRQGWQHEQPDHWLARPDPWEVARPNESVEVRLGCSFGLRDGALRVIRDHPSTLIGVPYDRPVIGYGGKTINTLRLWSALAPDYFDFQQFSSGDFVGALAETLTAETVTRVFYPTTQPPKAKACDSCSNIFSWPARWLTLSAGSTPLATSGPRSRKRSPCNSTTPTLPWRSPN